MLTNAEEQILDYSTDLTGLDIHFEDIDGSDLLDGTLSGPSEQTLSFQSLASSVATNLRSPARAVVRPVTITVNRRNGTFSGTMHAPGETSAGHSFSGVLLQHQNTGAGLVRLGLQTGRITVTPR